MSKHTPGPWCLSDESPMIIEDKHKVIVGSASTYPHSGYFPSENEAKANARLIAAAPDLLEALKSIAEFWNRDHNEKALIGACWHAVETAEAAIAKAEGEVMP